MSRYLKVIGILSLVLLISVFLAGCTAPGGGGREITTSQAATAAQTVVGGATVVMKNEASWTNNGSDVSYSNAGLSMTGTLTTVGTTYTAVLTIAFSSYADAATGYHVNGTVNLSQTMDTSSGALSATMTGNLTSSGGPVTAQTWNVSVGGTTLSQTFSGTVTCNGTSFDASTLSLGSTNQASMALAAVGDGLGTVMGNTSSWTDNGSDVSYSTTGLSMTGTKSESGSIDTLVMTITYTGFVSGTVYTVNGTVNVSVTNDHLANTMSGTITANLTLSGGPVTTLTCNEILSGTAGTSSPTATGTVTCNGTAFDVKTL